MNLNTLSLHWVKKLTESVSAEVWVLAWVKPLVEVTKDKNLVQVDLLRLVLRVVKCPFKEDYLRLVLVQEYLLLLLRLPCHNSTN